MSGLTFFKDGDSLWRNVVVLKFGVGAGGW